MPEEHAGTPIDSDSMEDWGRRQVRASSAVPGDALGFLGQPLMRRRQGPAPGAVPGVIVVPSDGVEPVIRVMSYDGESFRERTLPSVDALPDVLASPHGTLWIDVSGFGNLRVLEEIRTHLNIHPLAMADVVHVPQRPKAELHDGRLLVVTQMARITESLGIDIEQVSLVMGPDWVVSLQERPGDVFDPVRERIRSSSTRIRRMGADYLLYALIDAVIDGYFPVVEALGGVVDALEEEVVERPSPSSLARVHATRRTLLALHRVQWRQRDAVGGMLRNEELPLSDDVRPYLRDAHDHAFQTLDAIEGYRDMVVGLTDLQLSAASHRMNEVMKTLTIVATIFIPLTFFAGVYGMNFEHMPELRWRWGYAAFWVLIGSLAAGLVAWFRLRGWLGTNPDRND